jgi:uncharacterized protein (DUF1697 family)
MPMQVALVRGINVGGRKLIAMSDLRDLFTALGFSDVKSLLQSGNVVFRSDRREGIEKILEGETERRLGVSVHYMVRSANELEKLIARNPLPSEAQRDPSHFVVVFLKQAPPANSVQALEAAISGPEIIRAEGKHLYAFYPVGIGESKLTNSLIERKLGTQATGRNWNTVLKLAALMKA